MKISELPTDTLKELINRLLAARQKSLNTVAECDRELQEAIGEFYRRVCETSKEAP